MRSTTISHLASYASVGGGITDMDEIDFIPDSDLFKPEPGRSEINFPGRFRDYCESRGLDPLTAAVDGEFDYSQELKRAYKARKMLRLLNKKDA